MYNKTVLFILIVSMLSVSAMEKASVTQKKSKKDRIIGAVRAIPSSLFSNKKKKNKPLVLDAVSTVFSLQDLVGKIVKQIYKESDFHEKCKNVRKFSGINRITYSFCRDHEYTDKGIIRALAISYNLSDLDLAISFKHQGIVKKIYDMFQKAENPDQSFTQQDLQDTWVLEATRASDNENILYPEQETLLMVTIKNFDGKKTKALLKAGVSCSWIDPIVLMLVPRVESFNYRELNKCEQQQFTSIIDLLLNHGVHPDNRYMVTIPTLLHLAAFNHDQLLAHLLLKKYNANPYKLYIECDPSDFEDVANLKQLLENNSPDMQYFEIDDESESCKHNAFTLERGEPKGWLQKMYDEIQRKKMENPIIE